MDAFLIRPASSSAATKSFSEALLEASSKYCRGTSICSNIGSSINRILTNDNSGSPASTTKTTTPSPSFHHHTFTTIPSPIPLTQSFSSWIIHIPRFFPSPSRKHFQRIWDTHPSNYHLIQVYGKQLEENRYSQLYSTFFRDGGGRHRGMEASVEPTVLVEENAIANNNHDHTTTSKQEEIQETYTYSGTSRPFLPCDPSKEEERLIMTLCKVADDLVGQLMDDGLVAGRGVQATDSSSSMTTTVTTRSHDSMQQHSSTSNINSHRQRIYNCCLLNWYRPEHHIGLHSDDEPKMDPSVPILTLSWGGPRRFLLRPKTKKSHHSRNVPSDDDHDNTHDNDAISPVHEVLLKDGDLLIMGGKCQEEFKHEVPRLRKKDGLAVDRISWTIRCLLPSRRPDGTGMGTTNASLFSSQPQRRDGKRKRDG